jgi:metal-sulfur cluster biosynthetic enzyme
MSSERPTEEAVRARLEKVIDPCSEANGTDLNVIEMGLLKSIQIADGSVTVDLRVTSPHCMMTPFFVEQIEEHVEPLSGVDEVEVEFDAGFEWTPEYITEAGQQKRDRVQTGLAERAGKGGDSSVRGGRK